MKYEDLEQEYKKIFTNQVLPFIKQHIKEDFMSAPIYYLLEELNINRFRSGLPIIIAREYGINENNMIPLAALCELTFTTAMAQDDFYDDDGVREGIEATHIKFGIKETLLSCDYMNHEIIACVINILGTEIQPDILKRLVLIINKGMADAYSSVLMELESKKDIFSVKQEYLERLYLAKTAHGRILLECTFMIASLALNLDERFKIITAIKKYSECLAIAGQLKNDIYDFTKHKKYRGFSDLRQGYITYPLYLVIKDLIKKDHMQFLKLLNDQNYEALLTIFRKEKMMQKTLFLINSYVTEAMKLVKNNFPPAIAQLLNLWAEGNRHFSIAPEI